MANLTPPPIPEWLPGEKEELPRQDQVTRLLPNDSKVYGSLWITNYRLIFKSIDAEVDPSIRDFEVTIGSVKSIRKIKPSETSGTKVQSLLKIDSFDFQVNQLCFPLNSGGNNRTLAAVEKVLTGTSAGVTFALNSLENFEPLSVCFEASWVSGIPEADYERKGLLASNEFRMSELNSKYKLSPFYPPIVAVPNSASDAQIEASALARDGGQFPIVTWRNVNGGMLMLRAMSQLSTQPSEDDLVIIRLFMLKCPGKLLRVFDVGSKRTYTYPRTYVQFTPEHLDLPTQSHVAHIFEEILDSFHTQKNLHLIACNQSAWSQLLTRYLESISSISKLVDSGFSVLIQGSKKNFAHLAVLTVLQIVCDPSYRTLAGLCILLEKEWIHFTFPFKDHTMAARERGQIPIFELTLHLIWMLVSNYPTKFEYGEKVLGFILDHLFSCRFVTFQIGVRRDWDRLRSPFNPEGLSTTPNAHSIWAYIQTHASEFKSPAFDKSSIPAGYWPTDSTSAFGATPPGSPPPSSGALTIGLCPHLLPIDSLAQLPMIWRERFLQYDYTVRSESVKAASLVKPGYGGNSIFSLSPAFKSLCRIAPKILFLPGLTMLHFKNASLTHLPIEIVAATSLEDFSVAGNPIRHLPETWVEFVGSHLKRIRILDFDKTCIGKVVLSIHKHIPTLQTLKLGSLERMSELRALEIDASIPPWPLNAQLDCLELPSNNLSAIPPRFVNLVHVSQVDLAGNKFTNIPLQLECFARLSKLNFSDNQMAIIVPPQGGFRMDVLNSLNLAGNGLEVFPDHLGNLPALRSLSLARNKLSDLSQRFFMQFKLLDILDVSCNRLVTLPNSIGYMTKLTYFDLSGNALTMIPDSVVGMTNLKYLDLSYNKLPSLSVCFGRLKSLHTLKISYNSMTVLPPHLGSLRDTLQTFDFTDNDLVTPPLDIIRGGSKAVLDFLYDSLSGSKPIYRMKMMIVGEENVGKTTLVDQLTRRWKAASSDGIYEPISTLSTDGIAISACSFRWKNEGDKKIARLADEFDVNISWWDFAGQELYYTTHQFFLSGRSIFVVVWNLEKPIEDSRVDFWLNSIQSKIANATVVLVGTHLDGLKGPAKDAIPDLFKQTKLRLRMLFPSLDIVAYAASARTGEGMMDLKDALEKKIVGSKHMGEVLPSTYLLLERMVTDARATHAIPIISKHKFLEMSLVCNISGEKELFRASNLLHNLGTLIYFEQDLVLSRYVILDPQWLAKLMSTLITTKHSFVTAGVISHRALGQIWREFPLAMYGFLLGLLEKFEVTYNLSGFIDPASLHTPTALQLISLQERFQGNETGSIKKRVQKKSKNSGPTPSVMYASMPREWLHALIPMLKRHPTVVIGYSPLRRMVQYAATGLLLPGNRTTLAVGAANGVNPTTENSLRISTPPNQMRRVVSYYGSDSPAVQGDSSTSPRSTPLESPAKKYSPNVQKILERGDVVGSFDLDGVSLIPSLLPANPPSHFESRNMFPEVCGPKEVEFTRDYLFDFVPEGLVSRLTVRLLQRFLDQTKEFVMWKEGILLIRTDCTIFAHTLQRDSARVLRLHCRGTDFLEVGRVFSAALEANSILFKEWPRLRISQEVRCPHCVSAGINPPTYFPLETLLDAVRDDLDQMTCSVMFGEPGEERIEEFKLPLERLTPDFRLVYLKGTQLKFSDLVIEKQIGIGGFAVVYKGTYKGECIAVKQLHVGAQDEDQTSIMEGIKKETTAAKAPAAAVLGAVDMDPQKLQAELDAISAEDYTKAFNEFRKEAFMLSDISDEHCVRMHGVVLKPFCLVTEFVPCGDLYSLCHKEPLKPISWSLRLRIALDMAKGMHFLHSLKPPIIHNDLKSPNVLLASLDPDARVVAKISDFGLSMRMSKMYTRLVDNPVWVAPEIMRGSTYDTKADVYAFGVMLWEMLERRGFFEEVVFNSELEKKVMAGERPVIENDTLPEYEKLIRACWDNDPLRRPPFENVIALLEQLIVAYKTGSTSVSTSSEMLLPGAQRGRRAGNALNAPKPAFIREKSINNGPTSPISSKTSSPTGSVDLSSSPPQSIVLEPEIEKPVEITPPPSIQKVDEVTPPPTFKLRINVGGGNRKAPSRADIIAQAKMNAEGALHTNGTASDSSVTTAPLSPSKEISNVTSPRTDTSPTGEQAKLSSIDRLNALLGPNIQVSKPAVSPRHGTASPPNTSPREVNHSADALPPLEVPVSPKRSNPSLVSPTSPPSSTTLSTSPSSKKSPIPLADAKPVPATMKFQSRDGGRPVSLKTALSGSITGLLSSLQSLTKASAAMDQSSSDEATTSTESVFSPQPVPASSLAGLSPVLTPRPSPANLSNGASSEQRSASSDSSISSKLPATPLATASPSLFGVPGSSEAPTSSAQTAASIKNMLISETDAKVKITELTSGLQSVLKLVVTMSGTLRTDDKAAFQAAVLDMIKCVRAFRDSAVVPAGLKAVNPSLNEKLLLLRNSIKALLGQIVTLLQVARLLLKQDPAVTKESFATSATSFVSAFKITTGVLDMLNLDGVQVMEIEPVDLST